jgi:multiple sugar transport system substrate-binding protein
MRARMLVISFSLLLITVFTVTAGGQNEAAPAADGSFTLTMWGWDPAIADKIEASVAAEFPNLNLEMVPVDSAAAFTQKVRTSAAAGIPLPDLPWFERNQRGTLYGLDLWENLSAAPYNFDESQVFEFALATVRNEDGDIVAIPWDMAVGGLAYKRDLAEQYFGTSAPGEMESMFSDWDAFLDAGRMVAEQSNGEVFMFASPMDAWSVIGGQDPRPIIDGNVANISSVVAPAMERIIEMRQNGLIDGLNQWSPGWYAAIGSENHIFFPNPVWFPQFVIEPNDAGGEGNWAMMTPPGGGFNWGGTAIGIASDSENKEEAWDFLQWFLLSEDGAWVNRRDIGFLTHFQGAYDDPEYASVTSVMFGDQNIGDKWFNEIAPATQIRPVSRYDGQITDVLNAVMSTVSNDPQLDADTAIEIFVTELQQQIPDIEIR